MTANETIRQIAQKHRKRMKFDLLEQTIATLRNQLNEADRLIARLRMDIANPPPDVQDRVILKLNLVSKDALDASQFEKVNLRARIGSLEAEIRKLQTVTGEKCKHGIRSLSTNLPYCRFCDDSEKEPHDPN